MKLVKKLLGTILVLAVIATSGDVPFVRETTEIVQAAEVSSGRCGASVYWSFDYRTGTLTLTGSGSTYDYTYYQYQANVTPWHHLYTKMKRVVVSDNITHFGTYLFLGLASIDEIEVPASADFDVNAFSSLRTVNTVHITKGNSVMTNYSDATVTPWGKETVKHVIVEDGVKNISANAFYNCGGIEKITIADSVERIDGASFMNCTSLKELSVPCSVEFPTGGTSMVMFYNNPVFDKVTITKGTGSMKKYSTSPASSANTFCGVLPWARSENVYIESGVKKITDYAFYYGKEKNIILPESVEEIGTSSFYGSSLESIAILNSNCVIPDSASTIASGATIYYIKYNDNVYNYATKYSRTMLGGVLLTDGIESYSYIANKKYAFYTPEESDYFNTYTVKYSGAQLVHLNGYLYDAANKQLAKGTMTSAGEVDMTNYLEAGYSYMYCIDPVDYGYYHNEVTYPFYNLYFQKKQLNICQGSIVAENELTDKQVVELNMEDSDGVEGYYWGTSSYYRANAYYECTSKKKVTRYTAQDIATTDAIYYLAVKDKLGNVYNVAQATFCKTTLELNKGSYNQLSLDCDYIITKKGNTITLPKMHCSYYEKTVGQDQGVSREFNGWTTRSTYNWKSSTDLPDTVTFTVNGNSKYYAVWKLGVDDIRYSFTNGRGSLGYSYNYSIPASSYGLVYGYSSVYNLLKKVKPWGGSCYGFATTAGMFLSKTSDLHVTDFDSTAKNALALKRDSKGALYPFDVRTLIEAMQVSQFLADYKRVYINSYNSSACDLTPLLSAIDQVKNTGNGVQIALFGDDGGHALLAYDYKRITQNQLYIYIYDPNFTHGRYISLTTNGNKLVGWRYYINNDEWWGSSYNTSYTKNFIEYETIDMYSAPWKNRDTDEDSYYSLLLIESQCVKVTDANGNVVYKINGHTIQGNESVRDLEPYISDEGVTLLRVPVGEYTITNLDKKADSLTVNAANSENGVNVTTSANTVTVNVSAKDGLNSATVDASKGDTYDIEMTYINDDVDNKLSINGTAPASEEVVMDYSDNNLSVEGTDKFTMKVNGNKFKKVKREHVKNRFKMNKDLSKQKIVNK